MPEGDVGVVVADEPQAALSGHDVLARGGNAADAAAATGFALGVTLPSRASLGGGGACLVSRPGHKTQTIAFLPSGGTQGERPASVPMTARGLYMLHHRFGSVEFDDVLLPAITLAGQGITVSRALAADLKTVQSALLADDLARGVFGRGETGTVQAGDTLIQSHLAGFLTRLRTAGIGDLYNGALSDVYTEGARRAGGGLTAEAMRRAIPTESPTLRLRINGLHADFLAPPADGGIGAAAAALNGLSAQNTVAAWRASGASGLAAAQKFLDTAKTGQAPLPPLPASTSFVVTDRNGMAVSCALSENNLFGTGRMAGGTGVVLGASPAAKPQPLLSAAILRDSRNHLRAALAASGQNDAADALGAAVRRVATGEDTFPPHGAGRVNAVLCQGGRCKGLADPQGAGLAAASGE